MQGTSSLPLARSDTPGELLRGLVVRYPGHCDWHVQIDPLCSQFSAYSHMPGRHEVLGAVEHFMPFSAVQDYSRRFDVRSLRFHNPRLQGPAWPEGMLGSAAYGDGVHVSLNIDMSKEETSFWISDNYGGLLVPSDSLWLWTFINVAWQAPHVAGMSLSRWQGTITDEMAEQWRQDVRAGAAAQACREVPGCSRAVDVNHVARKLDGGKGGLVSWPIN